MEFADATSSGFIKRLPSERFQTNKLTIFGLFFPQLNILWNTQSCIPWSGQLGSSGQALSDPPNGWHPTSLSIAVVLKVCSY
jgi:hypothetical protein